MTMTVTVPWTSVYCNELYTENLPAIYPDLLIASACSFPNKFIASFISKFVKEENLILLCILLRYKLFWNYPQFSLN